MRISLGKCARQPRFSIGKCGRQPRFSIGKCGNTNLSRGGIIPKWAGKLPKQELFHRNLEPRRRVKETSPHPLGTRARKLHMVGAVGRPRICCANPHRLRPPAGALAGSLRTLRVRLTLAPPRGFESHRHLKEVSPHPLGTRARKLHMVGAVGLEPTILAARDFKSPAYANSATPP